MLELDHIVFAGTDIEKASVTYGRKYALKVAKGGEHEDWGTYNYLVHFSNQCYIEWLGVCEKDKAHRSNNPLITHLMHVLKNEEQVPFQFALRTTKLDDYVAHFTRKNIPYVGPVLGSRKKPDGSVLTWRMLFPTYDYTKEMLPFLIEWEQPENKRTDASLVNGPAITTIYYGGTTLERFLDIYQLPLKKRKIQKVLLKNSKIVFTDERALSIDVM